MTKTLVSDMNQKPSADNMRIQKLTEEQLLDDLETSRAQYEAGQYSDMGEAIQEIGERYGL